MSASPTWFMVATPIALIVFLAIAGLLLALLTNRRTRPVGLFLLVVGVVGMGLLMSTLWLSASHRPVVADYGDVPMHQDLSDHRQIHFEYHDTGMQHSTTKLSWGIGLLGGPFLVALALVVFALFKYRAATLPVIGVLGLGLFGFYIATFRSMEVKQGVVVSETPLNFPSHTTPTPSYAGHEAVEEVFGHMMHDAIPLEETTPATAEIAELPEPVPPEAELVQAEADLETMGTWAEAPEPQVSPLPPVAKIPATPVAAKVPNEQPPLEAVAAKEGVDTQQLRLAIDPDAAPAPQAPDWIKQPVERVGNVVRRVVSEGPHATADVAYERVQAKIGEAVHKHLSEVIAEEKRAEVAVPPLNELGITPRWIRENVVTEEHYASTDTSVANDMQTVFVRLEFSPRTTDALVEAWQMQARQGRVSMVGMMASGLLAAMGGVWGLIKLDTATKGYYTKRLFIGVPLAIIGGLTLLGLFVT